VPYLSVAPPAGIPSEVMCINFEKGWNGFQATKGVYVQSIGVKRRKTKFGKSAVFNGHAKLEMPAFTNSYNRYKQFGVSFWFKRTGSSDVKQGLFDNGNCEFDPSIMISSKKDSVGVRFVTDNGMIAKEGLSVRGISFILPALCYLNYKSSLK